MTKLTPLSPPLVRETATLDRDGPLVVELTARYLSLRVKGRRSEPPLTVPYDVLWDWLRKRHAEQIFAEGARLRKKLRGK